MPDWQMPVHLKASGMNARPTGLGGCRFQVAFFVSGCLCVWETACVAQPHTLRVFRRPLCFVTPAQAGILFGVRRRCFFRFWLWFNRDSRLRGNDGGGGRCGFSGCLCAAVRNHTRYGGGLGWAGLGGPVGREVLGGEFVDVVAVVEDGGGGFGVGQPVVQSFVAVEAD